MAWNPFRAFNRKTTESPTPQSQVVVNRSQAGVTVTADNAMKSSAIYAGIRYHAQTVGQLPWWAYKARRGGRGADILTTAQFDGVNAILHLRANRHMTSQRFREIMVTHAILYGNGVAEIARDQMGRAIALYPLRPDRLKFIVRDGETVEFEYQDERRGTIIFEEEDVFRIANFGSPLEMSQIGKSLIEHAAESIGWQQATELFGAAYFGNGIHPSGIITLKNALSPEAYKLFMEELRNKFRGSRGAHEPFVTDGEASFTKIGIQAEEAQFVETLQHQIDEIARWVGVPPSKIGHLIHSGVRANVEQEAISVIQDYVMPWVTRFETEADLKLFRENERHFTRMDLSALLRGDSMSRSEYYRQMLVNGVLSVNEVREMEDMNPIKDGDQHLVQGQYLPLSQVGKKQQALDLPSPEENNEETDNQSDPGSTSGATGGNQHRTGQGSEPRDATIGEEFSDEEALSAFRGTLHLRRD